MCGVFGKSRRRRVSSCPRGVKTVRISLLKTMGFDEEMMMFLLKGRHFPPTDYIAPVLKMMNCALKMMNCALKMMVLH